MGTNDTTSAGASAQREYDRRRARDEAKIRETWGEGRLGTMAVALSSERQSTVAWKSGAVGEAVVGRTLDAIASDDLVVLHDRRIPRSRANIDHIAVTRSGVWVIDAKRYRDKRPSLRVEGGLFRPRVEKLMVGGDPTRLVDSVLHQMQLVHELIDPVPVSGALCFVDADWPLIGGSFSTRGVEVCWPKKLAKRLTSLDGQVDVAATAAAIGERFLPA
ncbi:nuclease-related domain-containing protein [Curtobacterium sp. MCBD17_003]|uniref:nuclease-related domain-containing protein n=1 Tax=Curtobacterium sp. MCBD17_003 TaxID=2175667 RepID=UPI000DAAC40C|nr:nuclease-related domain-containing protein [Curtobacterium sp. MCBD17_003]WIE54801.1 nuclease-related domain-containing protein [Curtobacterium sp. MCBD17_003]